LGIFFFGVGITFAGGGILVGGKSFTYGRYIIGIEYWVFPAMISFLLAGILLAQSFTE